LLKPAPDDDIMVNIGLDNVKTSWWSTLKQTFTPTLTVQEAWVQINQDDSHEALLFGNILDQHFSELEQQFTALAERGVKHLSDLHVQCFQEKIQVLQRCGLSGFVHTIQDLISSPERRARQLLANAYLVVLYRQAAGAARSQENYSSLPM
jgi:hypothetical protein